MMLFSGYTDVLNVTLFNCTEKDWRTLNPEYAKQDLNIRDFASINELAVLSNIESLNAEMIKKEIEKTERFQQLREIAKYQLKIMNEKSTMKAIKNCLMIFTLSKINDIKNKKIKRTKT